MKIIADENIPYVKEAFSEFGEVVTLQGRNVNRDVLKDVDMLLVRSVTQVTPELIEETPVRFVASATIGIDHINVNYLSENNIGFAYAPGSNADSVAEYVTTVILEFAKKRKLDLAGLSVGIIGVGNVGSRVNRHLRAIGMNCLLYDPPQKKITGSDYYLELEEVLDRADIITIHVPLIIDKDESTYHMINHEFISRMKNGSILINTSRGKVVDEKSLRAELDKIGGIAFDVWENEPLINSEMLKNVDIATPHIAGYSVDGKIRGTKMIYDAVCAFFFRESSWRLPSEIFNKSEIVDLTKSQNPLCDAIEKAFPIMRDDRKLRSIFKEGKENHGHSFDLLRKDYPTRFEFKHYIIQLTQEQSAYAPILSELGFKVNIIKHSLKTR